MRLLILAGLLPFVQPECKGQNYGVPNYGTANYGSQTNRSGFGGRASNNSFNGGFQGLSNQAQAMPQAPQSRHQPAGVQASSTMAELEQTLNAVDSKAGWSNTPLSGLQNMPAAGTQRSSAVPPVPAAVPQNWRPGSTANAMSGIFPTVSRKEMMRVFIEGGAPQTGSSSYSPSFSPGFSPGAASSNSPANTSTAYSNYQTAENESAKARNEANTAHYGSNKWNRKDAATRAEYAANNANYAAQRAESAAYSGDGKARSYANLARQAANRARASANQARYNADTIP